MSTITATANISPLYVGDTKPNLQITVVDDTGAAFDLTGSTITMKMQLTTNQATIKSGVGTWTIDNAAQGKAHYHWNAADTNTSGEWYLWINLANSGDNQHLDPLVTDILYAPAP